MKTAVYIKLARLRSVAFYSRVACADTDSLSAQECHLANYAEANGYESGEFNTHHFYSDNGESGLTLDRPGMNRLGGRHKERAANKRPVSLSRNPVYAKACSGFLPSSPQDIDCTNIVSRSRHCRIASFFRFIAAYLSLTHLLTWDKPRNGV